MAKTLIISIFISCLSFVANAEHLQKIQWLSGAWQNTDKSVNSIELLVSKPYGNRMLASETTRTNKALSFEHFEIREKNGVVKLEVFPENQKNLTMRATVVTSKKIVFENPKHDFPKLWSFELKSDGTLAVSYTHLTLPTICSV